MVYVGDKCVKKVEVHKFVEVFNAWAKNEIPMSQASKKLGCDRQTFQQWVIRLKNNNFSLHGLPFLVDEKGEPYRGF